MELRPIQLAERPVVIEPLVARMLRAEGERHLEALREYEAECASDTWRERCAVKIADRVAELESQLRAAVPEDRFALLDALRTFRQALATLERELGRSSDRARRLSALREQASALPRLRLVQSS